MKVITDTSKVHLPKTLVFTVTDPLTYRDVYRVELTRSEAEESIAYLREHNGAAPEFVHAFIDAVEIALTLKVRS